MDLHRKTSLSSQLQKKSTFRLKQRGQKTATTGTRNHTMPTLPLRISVSSAVKPTHEGSKGDVKGASVRSTHKKKVHNTHTADDKLSETTVIEESRCAPFTRPPIHLSCMIFRSLRFSVVASLLRKGKKPSPTEFTRTDYHQTTAPSCHQG